MKKGKKLLFVLALTLLFVAAPAYAYGPALTNAPDYVQQYENGIPLTVHVDGRYVSTDVAPYISNSRTYLPLRAISEAMGASVSWNQSTQTATISKDGTTISCKINSTAFTVNGQTFYNDAAPTITQSRTMLPIRAIAEALGGTVSWDGYTASVTIDTSAADAAPPSLPSDIPYDVRWLVEKYYVPADGQRIGSWRCVCDDYNEVSEYLFISEMNDGSKNAVMINRHTNDGVTTGLGVKLVDLIETSDGMQIAESFDQQYWHGGGLGGGYGYNLNDYQFSGNDLVSTGYWFKHFPGIYSPVEEHWVSFDRFYSKF